MVKKSIAREYAKTLRDSVSKEVFRVCVQNAQEFGKILNEIPKMIKVLENPSISKDEKYKIIDLVGKYANFNSTFISFIKLLVEKKRISLYNEIEKEISLFYDQAEGIVRGKLFVSEKISDKEKDEIQNLIATGIKKKVLLYEEIKPEILGGFKVKIGSKVFDFTFENALFEIKNYLLKR